MLNPDTRFIADESLPTNELREVLPNVYRGHPDAIAGVSKAIAKWNRPTLRERLMNLFHAVRHRAR